MRRGDIIREGDKYWDMGKGPWTTESNSQFSEVGRLYCPSADFDKMGTCHHAYIRKVNRK